MSELASQRRPPQAVFIGDSITRFWLDEDPRLFWPNRLNRGVPGETTREILRRFDTDVIALRPRIVHIMAGTNDLWHGVPGARGEIALANLEAMLIAAREGGVRAILAAPPPIASYAEPMFGHPEQFAPLHAGTRALAGSYGGTYVDYADVLTDAHRRLRPEFTTDGVHLTHAGYRAMRAPAIRALQRAGRPER